VFGSQRYLCGVTHDPALFDVQLGSTFHVEPAASASLTDDAGLRAVVTGFQRESRLEERFASVFRQSLDEVLDGQRTGRFDIKFLEKTEKTYLGTKVEIVTRAEFELPRGERMDYKIDEHDVDAKFSLSAAWSIPREAMGHLCLLMAADDRKSTFDVGVVRISADILNRGQNQDGKKTISKEGKAAIVWLFRGAALPPNLLLKLPPADTAAIMASRSGQQRINELLRRVQGTIIDRTTAVTVARQQDGMKRCRDARPVLAKDGIVVLGHQNDGPAIARALQLEVPKKGTFVSVRLVGVPGPSAERPAARIGDGYYAVALPGEPGEPAPAIRY
jgi:hypothetical protein